MSGNNNVSSSVGIPGILFCIFVVLKLTNHIDWSWIWVTSPLWIPICVVICVLVIWGIVKTIE